MKQKLKRLVPEADITPLEQDSLCATLAFGVFRRPKQVEKCNEEQVTKNK